MATNIQLYCMTEFRRIHSVVDKMKNYRMTFQNILLVLVLRTLELAPNIVGMVPTYIQYLLSIGAEERKIQYVLLKMLMDGKVLLTQTMMLNDRTVGLTLILAC